MSDKGSEPRPRWVRVLLLLPIVAMLWVPSYNRMDPVLLGLPFFYAYQLLWVLAASAIIGIVYQVEHQGR